MTIVIIIIIIITSEDDVMEEDVVVTTPVTPGVSLHYPQVLMMVIILRFW